MNGPFHSFRVAPAQEGKRLDQFLSESHPQLSRSRIAALIRAGLALVDGKPARPSAAVHAGCQVVLQVPQPAAGKVAPAPIPLEIIYEDPCLLVLNKPAGLVVHPGAGVREGTLVAGLLHRDPGLAGIGGEGRSGLVHRLDRGTTGVMVVARSAEVHRHLTRQFHDRTVEKVYDALVWGRPRDREGIIDLAVGRDPRARVKMRAGVPGGRAALSRFRVTEEIPGFARVEVRILTGRTHQVRVHLEALGHPLIGDATYGGQRARSLADPGRRQAVLAFARPALHARRLAFSHPKSGESLVFEAPWPEDLSALWRALGGNPPS